MCPISCIQIERKYAYILFVPFTEFPLIGVIPEQSRVLLIFHNIITRKNWQGLLASDLIRLSKQQ